MDVRCSTVTSCRLHNHEQTCPVLPELGNAICSRLEVGQCWLLELGGPVPLSVYMLIPRELERGLAWQL